MQISTGYNSIVLISVYLPYQCPENEVEYLEKLGFINALTNELDTTCFVITGDWNMPTLEKVVAPCLLNIWFNCVMITALFSLAM